MTFKLIYQVDCGVLPLSGRKLDSIEDGHGRD